MGMKIVLISMLTVSVVLLAGCGAGAAGTMNASTSHDSSAATITAIQVTPTSESLALGETQQFTATATYSDGTSKDVTASATWTSSAQTLAQVNSSGVATAAGVGSAVISAAMGTISGSATLSVRPAELLSLELEAGASSIPLGTEAQLQALGHYTDGTSADLTSSATWASSDLAVATVDASGTLTTASMGSTVVSATFSGMEGSLSVEVVAPVLQFITVVPSAPSAAIGQTVQFSANGIFTDGSEQDLTSMVSWTTSDATIASVVASGLATGVAAGQADITATQGTIAGSAGLTVTAAVLASIDVTPDATEIPVGGNQQFVATGIFSDGSTQDLADVTWSSLDSSIASINQTGLAIGVTPGNTTISGAVDAVAPDTAAVTVLAAVPVAIAVTPPDPTIFTLVPQQFTATATFSDGSVQDVSASVTWASADPSVATISATGLASPIAAGVTSITASLTGSFGVVTGSTILTVKGDHLQTIVVTPAVPQVPVGVNVPFTATGIFEDGSVQDLTNYATWISSSGSVATISSSGIATSVAPGTTTITATVSGVSGSTTLTVSDAMLQSIEVVPGDVVSAQRTRLLYVAYGNYSDGSVRKLINVSWSSSKPRIASINGSGLARTKHFSGTVTIKASLNGVTGTATLSVSDATVISITVAPATALAAAGTTQPFQASASLSDGSTQDVTTSVRWSSSNYAVATVSSTGVVSAVSPGEATVTASYNGVGGTLSGSGILTVSSATAVSLSISPAVPTITLGSSQQFTVVATFSDGTMQDVTTLSTFTSSVPTVAVMNSTMPGVAVSSGIGSTVIQASFKGVSTSTTLTVE